VIVGQARIRLQTGSYKFQRELERLLALLAKQHGLANTESASDDGNSQGGGIAEAHFILAAQLKKSGVLAFGLQDFEDNA
jgi:hypothetical protein